MSKEAMMLALEALDIVNPREFAQADPDGNIDKATTALREALSEQPASYKIRMDLPASISSEAIEADKLLKPQPAQQKPLTDGQIVASNYPDGEENGPTIAAPDFELICFARQIEAAHGIKENT